MYRFEVLGDGPERAPLERMVSNQGLNNITFRGLCSSEVVLAALQSSRVFVSLSESEGTPTSALEAMAAGLPVIMTPSNLYQWLIEDGRHGFVTKSWSVGEILGYIDQIVTNDLLRQTMEEWAKHRARAETWERKARWITDLMSESLRTRPA
jgi:1,2-diacylglycerol 3-alpha-glucosyltransferase